MKQRRFSCLLVWALAVATPSTYAIQTKTAADPAFQFQNSQGVVRAVVTGEESFRNQQGRIETRFTLQVEEALKGGFPSSLSIFLPGGTVEGESVSQGCLPDLKHGEERVFFLNRGRGGQLELNGGLAGALPLHTITRALPGLRKLAVTSIEAVQDFTDQAAAAGPSTPAYAIKSTGTTNLFTESTYGLPARFIAPDRGEPIPYLVDADALPPGMSLETALTAVSHALQAWKAVAFVDFQFEGLASFGMSAADVNVADQRLRLQLHNSYGEISTASTLGIGGRGVILSVLNNGWTTGGLVYDEDYHHTSRGYVVLNHTASSMQNAVTFEEVLCHEIGHALGMGHSSEDSNEPTASPAYQAIMYYRAHADGRGAAPSGWDINVLHQSHPLGNSPPYSFHRMMDITTAAVGPAIPGINEIALKGDLQSAGITGELYNASTTYGIFTLAGKVLRYTPSANYSDSGRLDPSGNSSYANAYYRLSDGVHASPWARVRVLSFSQDTQPSGSIDGLPDNWMVANFGQANPAAGPNRNAQADYDGDGLSNLEEYQSRMDPKLLSSAQRLTAAENGTVSWQAEPYELYELWSSTNLNNWKFLRAVLATNHTPGLAVSRNPSGLTAYRVVKVP